MEEELLAEVKLSFYSSFSALYWIEGLIEKAATTHTHTPVLKE